MNERQNVELAGGVKPKVALGDILAQNPVGADDPRRRLDPVAANLIDGREIDDEQMIAARVIGVLVAAAELCKPAGLRRHLFEENPIAQLLRQLDFGAGARQANFKAADAAVDLWLLMAGKGSAGTAGSAEYFEQIKGT